MLKLFNHIIIVILHVKICFSSLYKFYNILYMTTESKNIITINELDVYQIDKLILKNVSFNVKNGDFVYLIGKTGSGKSSLLKVLYGDIKVIDGNVEVLDYKIKKIKKRKILALRRKIGIIFQDFQLLMDRSVSDNLIFVMKATGWKGKKKMNDKITELLTKVGKRNGVLGPGE